MKDPKVKIFQNIREQIKILERTEVMVSEMIPNNVYELFYEGGGKILFRVSHFGTQFLIGKILASDCGMNRKQLPYKNILSYEKILPQNYPLLLGYKYKSDSFHELFNNGGSEE